MDVLVALYSHARTHARTDGEDNPQNVMPPLTTVDGGITVDGRNTIFLASKNTTKAVRLMDWVSRQRWVTLV